MTNQETMKPLAASLTALLAVACLFPTHSTHASGNLLSNGDMEDPGSGPAATDWTGWTWGGAWANYENPDWGNGTMIIAAGYYGGGGAGFYQIVGGAENVEYTLSVDSGADDWFLPTGRMIMFFLDATGTNVLYETNRTTVDPMDYASSWPPVNPDDYDIPHPWSNYTLVATSPPGTALVKVEFANNDTSDTNTYGATGMVGFDNASLTAPIDPPVITDVYPFGLLMPTNALSFTAISAVAIEESGIKVVLNGQDVSTNLVIGAGSTNRSVRYPGLESNQTYTAVLTVTDTANLTTIKTVEIDTMESIFTWEAEDYDFNSGHYINDPSPSDSPGASNYFGLLGTEGVDYHDQNGNGDHGYRSSDSMGTSGSGDAPRQQFFDAGASDYNVGWFDGGGFSDNDNDGIDSYEIGDWVNYTREFPAGTYNMVGRLANGNGGTQTIPLSRVTSGWGTSTQTTEELGVFQFPGTPGAWGNYQSVPLIDPFGNKVELDLSGTNTLRVMAGSGGNLNFFMLVPVDTDRVRITDVYPDGRTLLQATNKLTFTVSSANSIAQSNVVLTLNGVDVSGSLSFAGSPTSWTVSTALALGVTNYAAAITATDDVGNSHSTTLYFDTFNPAGFVVEGEDFDFGGGMWIDNPVITSFNATNSYFEPQDTFPAERAEVLGTDAYLGDNVGDLITNLNTGTFRYRALSDIRTDVNGDTPLPALVAAQSTNPLAFSYNVSYMRSNTWLNYTRTYPTGKFNVYARLASDLESYALPFKEVNGTTTVLGYFEGSGRGFNFFDWIPLVETNGALAKVTLGGVTTLRFTTPQGQINPNNFLFVPAVTLPTDLQWSYAAGVLALSWDDPAFHLQSQTNAPGAGLTSGWSDYPGGGSSPVEVTVDPSQGSVFFRLLSNE